MSDIQVTAGTGGTINVSTGAVVGPLPQLQVAAGNGITINTSGGVSTISANVADLSIPVNLADLTNVSGLPSAGQVLAWDGSTWAPADDQTGGSSDVANLADLSDVSGNAAAAGQALTWDGTKWAAANVPVGTTINSLSGAVTLLAGDNINISTAGQNITIGTIGQASISNITDLLDVNATMSPANGQALVWDGSAWTADSVTALVSNGTTLDLGTGKVLYSNVYDTLADLPAASDYHGMFAHVHNYDGLGTGAAFYAHAGNWVRLADNDDVPTTLVSTVNGLSGSLILAGGTGTLISQSGNQLTISSTLPSITINGQTGPVSLVGGNRIDVSTSSGTITASANLSGYATESYVDSSVANLVNSAPAALDTLSELANALNNDSDFAANVTTLIGQKADANHSHVKANITDLTTSDLDLGGNRVLFANYYATQADFPSATTYHGMVAHSHADGAFYGAHAGAWVRLANYGDIPTGITWSTPPQNSSSPGDPGDVAYDDNYFYLKTSQAWRQVPLQPISTAITISQQPQNATVGDGDSAAFTVLATAGGETISYQWASSSDGVTFADVAGATTNTLTLNATLDDDGTQYRVLLSAAGASDVTSDIATLTVSETFRVLAENGDNLLTESGDFILHDGVTPTTPTTPTISFTSHPQDGSARVLDLSPTNTDSYETVTFSASATASDGSAVQYQWQNYYNSQWVDLTGYTSATASISVDSLSLDGSQYRVVASSATAPAVASQSAQIVVSQPTATYGILPTSQGEAYSGMYSISLSGGAIPISWVVSGPGGDGSAGQNPLSTVTGTTESLNAPTASPYPLYAGTDLNTGSDVFNEVGSDGSTTTVSSPAAWPAGTYTFSGVISLGQATTTDQSGNEYSIIRKQLFSRTVTVT